MHLIVLLFIFQSSDTAETAKPASAVDQCRGPNCSKSPKPGSIYCGESCIREHAAESLELLENEWVKSSAGNAKTEVCVFEHRVAIFR